jgi:hypothetical protein
MIGELDGTPTNNSGHDDPNAGTGVPMFVIFMVLAASVPDHTFRLPLRAASFSLIAAPSQSTICLTATSKQISAYEVFPEAVRGTAAPAHRTGL